MKNFTLKYFNEQLKIISSQVSEAMRFESDDEALEYEINMLSKKKIEAFIFDIAKVKYEDKISNEEYEHLLKNSLHILSSNTGCAEDLEILETILDPLFDKGIIDSERYKNLISSTACNRWL